jgi:sugar phosphate isomerase/epimerase
VFGGAVPKGSTDDQAAAAVVECLLRAGDYAARRGIILGLENHGGITTRAERIIDIVRKVNSPWVQMNLDTGNFRSEVYQQFEMCLPYAANVQVKVENVDESGKRVPQDWERVVKMLAGSGYQGYLALEYEHSEPPLEAVPRLLAKLRELARRYSA